MRGFCKYMENILDNINSPTQYSVMQVRRKMALYAENEDMITVGAYKRGSSPAIDDAIDAHSVIEDFLMQDEYAQAPIEDTLTRLGKIAGVQIPQEEYADSIVLNQ